MVERVLHEQNRRSWNEATRAHNSHKRDQAKFLREGGELLFDEELALLGDLDGKRLVHLQCNAGQDTVCLARRGARVVGVDISDEAIAFAERLAHDVGVPARFVRADVFDWLEAEEPASFDLVFSSYGTYGWLSDLEAWARGIARVLVPGGRFVLMEFHPAVFMFNEAGEVVDDYADFGRATQNPAGVGDYVAGSGAALAPSGYEDGVREFVNPETSHEFYWGLGDIVTAVAKAGLVVERLDEHFFSNGCRFFAGARDLGGRRWGSPPGKPNVPQMFGLAAKKP